MSQNRTLRDYVWPCWVCTQFAIGLLVIKLFILIDFTKYNWYVLGFSNKWCMYEIGNAPWLTELMHPCHYPFVAGHSWRHTSTQCLVFLLCLTLVKENSRVREKELERKTNVVLSTQRSNFIKVEQQMFNLWETQ